MKKFDIEMDEALKQAILWAKNIYSSNTIYAPHLFLGMLKESTSYIWSLMWEAGVDVHVLFEKIKMLAEKYEKIEFTDETKDMFYAPEVINILKKAEKTSKTDEITAIDVLKAFFSVKNSVKNEFKNFDFSLKNLNNALEKNGDPYTFYNNDAPITLMFEYPENATFTSETTPQQVKSQSVQQSPSDFITNLSMSVKASNKAVVCLNRENEVDMIMSSLMKIKKNNVILYGHAGVGKTQIVEYIAYTSNDFEIYSLNVNNMYSDTRYRGDLEARMKTVLEFFVNQPKKILFIDEAHMLKDTSGVEGGISMLNVLKPAMGRGEIKLILCTTDEEYAKFIETDKAISRRCTTIKIDEPVRDTVLTILDNFARANKINVKADLLGEIYEISNKYIKNRYFPDKAIDILETTYAYKKYLTSKSQTSPTNPVLNQIEKEKWEIVNSHDYSKVPELLKREQAEIKKINEKKIETPAIVIEKGDVYNVLKNYYGIEYKRNFNTDDIKSNINQTKSLIFGHDEIIEDVYRHIYINYYHEVSKPLSMLFLGSTGIGKTELSKLIGKHFFNDKVLKIDLSSYNQAHSVDNLIGSPVGYTGHGKPGILSGFIQNNPQSLIILDEVEKANQSVHDLLLGVLDDGILTDRRGFDIDCKYVTFIMTSNQGVDRANSSVGFTKDESQTNIDSLLKLAFRPEFINRIEHTYFFKSPQKSVYIDYIKQKTQQIISKYSNINVKISDNFYEYILQMSDTKYGFKNIEKVLKKELENKIIYSLFDKKELVTI